MQEIEEKARTGGEYHSIGKIYDFSIMVKTESSLKDLFQCSVNRFFVKGKTDIYYTHNNGKIASDPKLACLNFLNALEKIPKVIESHEKELSKASANIDIYTAIAQGSWKKEDELRSLKSQASELDRKIALTLAKPNDEKQNETQKQQEEHPTSKNTSLQEKQTQSNKTIENKILMLKPKGRKL